MKKIILLLLIISFALPVCAETIILSNRKKLVNCNFYSNGHVSCMNGFWDDTDCKDKGICLIGRRPDSHWAKFENKVDGFMGGLYLPQSNYVYQPTHFFNVTPSPLGGYYGTIN